MAKKDILAGFGSDGTRSEVPVLTGDVVFDFVDSRGFPLDILLQLMEEENIAFDVLGFIKAAKNSGNYENIDRLRILIFSNLVTHGNEEIIKTNVNKCLDLVYGVANS